MERSTRSKAKSGTAQPEVSDALLEVIEETIMSIPAHIRIQPGLQTTDQTMSWTLHFLQTV